MKRASGDPSKRRSIFRSLFAPLFLIMILQALIFYFAAVYGGIEESLSQNAADVLNERLLSRKYELETQCNTQWTDWDSCRAALANLYADYETEYGGHPFALGSTPQIGFLQDSAPLLMSTLRQNEVNGIFLILNGQVTPDVFPSGGSVQKYGLCIRDMDQTSNYSGTEDLLLERAPSSLVETLGCSLDSWWEAKYEFTSEAEGDYYYRPLYAAWENPDTDGDNLLYCSGVHRISGSDPAMISLSIPLIAKGGYPYGVLGVELSVKYLSSLLPNRELSDPSKCCYVLALQEAGSPSCDPLLGTGTLYTRCFSDNVPISLSDANATGGFNVTGRSGVSLYGSAAQLNVYNNNSPFESRRLTLLAFVERSTLFFYIERVKRTLLAVSAISLLLGVAGILLMSRTFAAPIKALAKRVRGMQTQPDFQLDRLGITEIDQLVDAIEELNRNIGKNSARTEFFSRMSHDMRTPMNAIISFSSPALLEDADEALKDDYLQKIHASGEYLLALINEVLDMTKIESNKTELHLASVQACRLFDTTVPIIEKLAHQKGIRFSVENTLPAHLFVKADVQHINQIVMNLLSNAVKFTPEGGSVTMTAGLTGDDPTGENALCRVVIADTGIGMSEEFLKNLYTPFEQENSQREGTGLGLSIAQKLVALMGGSIECVSNLNRGTAFTVVLPLKKAAAVTAPTTPPLPEKASGSNALRGKRILVCEDNAINMLIVQRLLEKWGVRIEHAENGQAGVDLFASSPLNAINAVLMDVQMPVMNGLDAARAIRSLDRADAKTVPIIAMTANAFQADEQASRDAGMNLHLAKPVEPDLLFSTLSRLLG